MNVARVARILCLFAAIAFPISESKAEVERGLVGNYRAIRAGDFGDPEPVCLAQAGVWPVGEAVSVYSRSFYVSYAHGTTPCAEVGPWDWWQADYRGLFRVNLPDGAAIPLPVDFVIDVNDGVRFTLSDLGTGEEVCGIDFWQDVPAGWNYQSTDAFDIYGVCTRELVTGELYAFDLSIYHQSEMSESALHNRAWLNFIVRGLGASGATVEFLHDTDEPGPPPVPQFTVTKVQAKVKDKHGEITVDAKLRMTSTLTVDAAFVEDALIECFAR